MVMPKEDPSWRFALGASPETEGFLVTVRSDDGDGIGWASVIPHLGTTRPRLASDLAHLAARVSGADGADLDACVAVVDATDASNPARAGVELALYDLVARSRGVPLHALLGEKARDEVALLRILAIKTPAEMADIARRHVAEGYRYLKIKLEGDLDADVARVRAIRGAVGDEVTLTVDANQSYRVPEAIRAIERLERFAVALVEQPVAADDLDGLATVARAVATPVEADESAASLDDVRRLVEQRAVDSVSLKLPKLGGVRKARAAVALCREAGVSCRVGAHVGSRLLAAAALHFAAATPEVGDVAELGEFARLRNDPVEGLEVERGRLHVPATPGVGVRPRARATAGP